MKVEDFFYFLCFIYMEGDIVLEVKNVFKCYKTGDFVQRALDNVSVRFRKSEFVSILGTSGSGKTTFLNILGGLDNYDSGDLIINGKSTKRFKDKNWDIYRNNSVGFIFQNYNLIPHIRVIDNVCLAMTISGVRRRERKKRALAVLSRVGLLEHAYKKPSELSGGQMQRVAIARALVNDPDIILADEPTGALDFSTSLQIMDLIKEISRDKLVIMVTHNGDIARNYSNRIIRLQDGKIVDDSNPYFGDFDGVYNFRKTSMSFFAALKLSFANIFTKKKRTLLTSFASSIGIVGIALVLSISNGFGEKINEFERNSLLQMPITVSNGVIDASDWSDINDSSSIGEYTSKKMIIPRDDSSFTHVNRITDDYVSYINNIDETLLSGVSYQRDAFINVVYKADDSYRYVDNNRDGVSSFWNVFPDDSLNGSFLDNYDVLVGEIDTDVAGFILVVDEYNRVSSDVFRALGFSADISFSDILSLEYRVVFNDDFYYENDGYFFASSDYEAMYNSDNSINVFIQAIVRPKKGRELVSSSGIFYTSSLIDKVISVNKDSLIVKKQRESSYSVLSFDNSFSSFSRDNILSYLGDDVTPSGIMLYPSDFDAKEKIVSYLDKYNDDKNFSDKIFYTDMAYMISSLSGGIMSAITIVLVSFSSISLVVSSIMIGIITYISVLERTREVGILRALGARKRDITRVFNAETFIIGACSGCIGIGITVILNVFVNKIIYKFTELSGVSRLGFVQAITLIIVSIFLTLIGGYIPARLASKKSPVVALRSE